MCLVERCRVGKIPGHPTSDYLITCLIVPIAKSFIELQVCVLDTKLAIADLHPALEHTEIVIKLGNKSTKKQLKCCNRPMLLVSATAGNSVLVLKSWLQGNCLYEDFEAFIKTSSRCPQISFAL